MNNNEIRSRGVNNMSGSGSDTEPMRPISPVVRVQSQRPGHNTSRGPNSVNTLCECFI